MKWLAVWAGVLAAALGAGTGSAELRLHWEDAFNAAERRQLSDWLEETEAALTATVGPLPFPVHVFLHRRNGAREPVPWAHTRRYRRQSVVFHVDPEHGIDALRSDWTAAHELSHLVLPYLGERYAWLAEGFASYMQYQVMQAQGTLSAADAAARYRRHLERAAQRYRHPALPFAVAAPKLRAARQYPTMYWGGAAYFLRVDHQLQQQGSSLRAVLRDYLACCRDRRGSAVALIAELDRLSGSQVLSAELERFQRQPGFPPFRDLPVVSTGAAQ